MPEITQPNDYALRTRGGRNPPEIMEALAALTQCRRGQEIQGSAQLAENWYRVVSGAAIKFTMLADGRRQIIDFLLPGDFFGFTAEKEHAFAVEAAVEGTVVARYPRQRVEFMADTEPRVGRLIREMAFETISRLQARMLMLGRKTAPQKLASFLIAMAERSAGGTAEVNLPMSRYDIADYLAISVETVSRAMTGLRHSGAIKLTSARRIRIIDPGALDGQ